METETEEWRSIPGREGRYEVSSFGRVRSLRHVNGRINRLRATPLILAQVMKCGYRYVSLGTGIAKRVNRLVLIAFHGKPRKGDEAAHQDGDKLNNRSDNLKWMTTTENNRQRGEHGTQTRGSKINTAVLNEEKVAVIKDRLYRGERPYAIGREYGVHGDTISLIKNGRRWKHVAPAEDRERQSNVANRRNFVEDAE